MSTSHTLRIATYNIHKGVQGLGPAQRLEIHNLAHAVEQFDADLICLQEVRSHHRKLARRFDRWPEQGQADYLLPEGYEAVYRTNARTRHGEHGNALLTRWPVSAVGHEDVSDHPFEQRGLLHVCVLVDAQPIHVVVVHLGLLAASRERQVQRLAGYLHREVPGHERLVVAGDFNDWGERVHRHFAAMGLQTFLLFWVHDMILRSQTAMSPDLQTKLVVEVVGTTTYLVTTCTVWGFGVRPAQRK